LFFGFINNSDIRITVHPEFVDEFGGFGTGVGLFNAPLGIELNDTHIFVADNFNHRIQIFDQAGNFKSEFGQLGSQPGNFSYPTGIVVNETHVIVTDTVNNRVHILKHQLLLIQVCLLPMTSSSGLPV